MGNRTATLSIDEADGDYVPDTKAEERKRRRVRMVAIAVVVVLAVGVVILLLPTTPSANVYVNPYQSSCAGSSTFSCTVVLDAHQGTVTVSQIKTVLINGTNTTPTVSASGSGVVIHASVPGFTTVRGLPDIGSSQRPPTAGAVTVYLSNGDSVSVVLGAGGIAN